MILTVTLNATIDIVVPVNNLKKGMVQRTNSIYMYPGGKGTNVARALSTLGVKVYATGFCGEANYAFMDNFLKTHGVINKFIKVKGENRPCILITEKNNETIINSESSFNITKNNINNFISEIKKLSKICKFAVLSGSLPICLPENFYEITIKKMENSYTLLDTSSTYLKNGIKASPDVIKLNIDELQKTFDIKLKTRNSFKNFIFSLSKKYKISTIIITLNEKGAILYDSQNFYYFKPPQVKNFISPVGSGDAFSAGFIYGTSKGMDKVYSIKLAMACSAANLMHYGSCFFKKKEIDKFLNRIKICKY